MQFTHNMFFLFFLFSVAANALNTSDFEDKPNIDEEQVLLSNTACDDEERSQPCPSQICGIPPSLIFDKFLQGGNLITGCAYMVAKGYWLVAYVAQAGCTLTTSDIFNKIVPHSSWAWQECKILAPCDLALASSTLCTLDQVGDIAGYINIGFAVSSCALAGYQIYKSNKEK